MMVVTMMMMMMMVVVVVLMTHTNAWQKAQESGTGVCIFSPLLLLLLLLLPHRASAA